MLATKSLFFEFSLAAHTVSELSLDFHAYQEENTYEED